MGWLKRLIWKWKHKRTLKQLGMTEEEYRQFCHDMVKMMGAILDQQVLYGNGELEPFGSAGRPEDAER